MIIAIIQARMNSSRLPGKVLKTLAGKPVLKHIFQRAERIIGVDKVIVATSDQGDDDPIAQWCEENEIPCYRGSLHNVLERFVKAAEHYKASTIIRLTGDCPLSDPYLNSQILALYRASGVDYCGNATPQTWPDGLDCEIFSVEALQKTYEMAEHKTDLEHVTSFIRRNYSLFSIKNLACPFPNLQAYRWTLDTQEDYDFLGKIYSHIDENATYLDILNLLNKNHKLRKANEKREKKQALLLSDHQKSFKHSERFLKKAEKLIPLGSQTFSKSKLNFNLGCAPLFATHGQGGRLWDIDGNGYVDMVMGLLPVSLGYNDPDINHAIRGQLNKGIIFSLATELEYELASKIVDLIPCAEQVRFGKNGTDATSAAVRLARAYTGREQIIVCGYHGWQDWYIGSTVRHKGVPEVTRGLTHSVPYNDLNVVEDLLKSNKDQIAALIMEPANVVKPDKGYLADLKTLLHQHDSLLIFDEIITGFRLALGGAQELFGVTPDLACFGKGIANGMPLSVIAGRKDVMQEMEEIFFSGTFSGETLSLAAAVAVLNKMQNEPVIEKLWSTGDAVRTGVENILKTANLDHIVTFSGFSPWFFVNIADYAGTKASTIKTFLLHELFKEGVLSLGTHNICYAHSQDDIQHIIKAYETVVLQLADALKKNHLEAIMDYPETQPVFQVRKTA